MLATARFLIISLAALAGLVGTCAAQTAAAPALPPAYRVDGIRHDAASQQVIVRAHVDNLDGTGRSDLVIVCDSAKHTIVVTNVTLSTQDLYPLGSGACETFLDALRHSHEVR